MLEEIRDSPQRTASSRARRLGSPRPRYGVQLYARAVWGGGKHPADAAYPGNVLHRTTADGGVPADTLGVGSVRDVGAVKVPVNEIPSFVFPLPTVVAAWLFAERLRRVRPVAREASSVKFLEVCCLQDFQHCLLSTHAQEFSLANSNTPDVPVYGAPLPTDPKLGGVVCERYLRPLDTLPPP